MKLLSDSNKLKRKSGYCTGDLPLKAKEFKEFTLSKKCKGLAAPQVGIFEQYICIKSRSKKKATVMFYPEIVKESKKTWSSNETCVTLGKNVKRIIQRPMWVKVAYVDEHRKNHTKLFFKKQAAVACHVVDILNGILITQK